MEAIADGIGGLDTLQAFHKVFRAHVRAPGS
jgi:hypothetical protein